MRELKFRAWLEGTHDNITFTDKSMEYEITVSKGVYADIEGGWDIQGHYPSIPIMQFTGLKDKNGVDIYEGDIVSFVTEKTCYDGLPLNIDRTGKVFWMEFRSVFAIQINNFMNQDLYKFIQYDNTVEVIGNIHENPESLAVPTAVL